jgi:ribosomal protein L11 methyltransferase
VANDDAAASERPSSWWQVRAVLRLSEGADLVADLLWSHGAQGIEERTTPDGTLLLAGFPTEHGARAAADALLATAIEAELGPIVDDGVDAWRAHASTQRAGSFWLVPAWLDPPPEAADRLDRVLLLDPGRSFGSGSHPTTRLVIAQLEELVAPGARVLDVGCGSGALSLAAARLGAASVDAIDIDPDALAATQENARRNGVDHVVQVVEHDLAGVVAERPGSYDVVAANLLAPVLADLAGDLASALAPGGALVASGILADRWEATATALAPLEVDAVAHLDGWSSLVLRTPARRR